MRMRVIFLFFSVLWIDNCFSQSKGSYVHEVHVGDKVPDFVFKNMINYSTNVAKISDFKGKLLILDFWSTGCSSCIESWPHLLDMQRKFGDKIQILLVNPFQNEKIVKAAFERRKKIAGVAMTLPASCYDTAILSLFHVSGVPHVVWIDKDGNLQSVTYSASVNEKNIMAIIQGQDVKMTQKINNDEFVSAKYESPLFIGGNGGSARQIYAYSILAKSDNKLFPTYGLVSNENIGQYFVVVTNYPMLDLYRLAYSNRMTSLGLDMILMNKVILKSKDSLRYVGRVGKEVSVENLFCYQLVSPPANRAQLQVKMQKDLDAYVGLNVRWVKKTVKCLVLAAGDTALIKYRAGSGSELVTDSEVKLNGCTISRFLEMLEMSAGYTSSPYPFVDETYFKGKLGDIQFICNVTDYRSLARQLQKFKLKLSLQDREVDMLLIEDSADSPRAPLY